MAVLTTYEAMDSILPYLIDDGYYWIGAAKNPGKAKNAWFWLSGEPIPQSFGRWREGEPGGTDDCVSIHKAGTAGLCDDPCAADGVGYVCQLHLK